MNTYQNKEARKYLFGMAAVFCAAVAVLLVVLCLCSAQYKSAENQAVRSMLAVVRKAAPDADLPELVQALNGEGENDKDGQAAVKEALARYGVENSGYYIKEMKSAHARTVFLCVGIFCIMAVLMGLCFVCYLKERQKKLFLLEDYMEHMFRGEYDLDLTDNSEDELSSLKNELYKLTVFLKEQAELARKQKEALSESVSDISHQLKTPLTSAQILMDNIMDNPDMDAHTRQTFIQEIFKQINGMSWMIVSMLRLSRLDAGVVEFERTMISLDQMIREAMDNLEVIAELKGVEVDYPAGRSEALIEGDYNWNREAVQNILKNAIEHSSPQEQVTVRLQQNDVYTAITVTNRGETLTKEQQKQIFERYYSGAKSGSDSIGIGLALAKAILERQGGYLSVESEHGQTSFVIKFIKNQADG